MGWHVSYLSSEDARGQPGAGPDDDWLSMNLRRVQSPEERPGTNTSIGRIDVFDTQSQLVEKTDWSGFVEEGSFNELRFFARDCMDWMATRRFEEAEQRRQKSRTDAPMRSGWAKKRMEEAIAATPPDAREGVEKAFASYQSSRDRQVDARRGRTGLSVYVSPVMSSSSIQCLGLPPGTAAIGTLSQP